MQLTAEEIINIQEELKDILLKGTDINSVLKVLSKYFIKELALIDVKMDMTYYCPPSVKLRDSLKEKTLSEIKKEFFCRPLSFNNDTYSYLVSTEKVNIDKKLEKLFYSIIETPLLLLLQKKNNQFLIKKEYKDKFVRDILFEEIESMAKAEEKANLYGWKFTNLDSVQVFLMTVDDNKTIKKEKMNKIAYKFENKLNKFFSSVINTIIGNNIVFIVSSIKETNIIKQTLEVLKSEIESFEKENFLIAVGNKKSNLLLAHQSYNEAIIALKIGKKVFDKNIYYYNDLGAYKLLSSVHNTPLAEDFLNKYLIPIEKYDQENNQDLLSTLSSLVENDWDIKKVSQKQYVHYNTVKYRIKKIADIINLDLSSPENKLNLALAIKLKQLNR